MTTGGHVDPDVLVIGSGPCGSAVARLVLDRIPEATVLVAEAGPRLGDQLTRPGVNVRNLDASARAAAEALCARSEAGARSRLDGNGDLIHARPGTHLLPPADMPGAAYSSNTGGMAAHWTCAVPRPRGSERVSFIPSTLLDAAFGTAERLLAVSRQPYPSTAVGESVRRNVQASVRRLDADAPAVRPMPLACAPRAGGRQPEWTGVDTILGDVAGVALTPDTLCRQVLVCCGRAVGAVLEERRTGMQYTIRCRVVVLAAGAFHTPQLLWASGVRPPALGRYLNVHQQVVATVSVGSSPLPITLPSDDDREHLTSVYWVLFDDAHPFHGQVLVTQPPELDTTIVSLAWYVPSGPTWNARIDFSARQLDARGLPAPYLIDPRSAQDRRRTACALSIISRVAPAIGPFTVGGAPVVLPSGKSLHYQGSTRMGATDDGTSVCNATGQVWGVDGLYTVGPNVIPTATACNPTLTAVALACITAEDIVRVLIER